MAIWWANSPMAETIKIVFTLNSSPVEIDVEPGETLLHLLRERLDLTGAKRGCGIGACGACTVIIDGRAAPACRTKAVDVGGKSVRTIEGLARDGVLHPLQRAFIDHGAIQCGYCTPGMIMRAAALLEDNPSPSRDEVVKALRPSLCRCTGYKQIVDAVLAASRGEEKEAAESAGVVGVSIPRVDAADKATGKARYTADLKMAGVAHGFVLRSGRPHARVLEIDASAAESMDGVIKVILADDIPGEKLFGKAVADQPVLAFDRVRFIGDAIALVIGETPRAAEAAAQEIKVRYDELEPVFDPQKALEEGAPPVHEGGNLACRYVIKKGDVEAALSASDVVVSGTYRTGFVEHACLETEAALAYYDGEGTLTVMAPSQNVFFDRKLICRALNLGRDRVRVIQPPMGGAFGKREDIYCQILAALGAYVTKRPVRIVLSREDSFRVTTKRHPFIMCYTTGADKDGRLTAARIRIIADTGAYASWAPNIMRKALVHAAGPYEIPNVDVEVAAVYTNNAVSGAMRGFGATQIALAYEGQIEAIARKLGKESAEVRKLNCLRAGAETVTGQVITSSVGLAETIERASAMAGERKGGASGKLYGRGMASIFYGIGYGHGIPDIGSAALSLREDGGYLLRVGAVDYGQGSSTVFVQIAAEVLNAAPDMFEVISGDSRTTPDSGSTVASRQTYVTGNAVKMAAGKLGDHILRFTAGEKGRAAGDLKLAGGGIVDSSSGMEAARLADIYRAMEAKKVPVMKQGRFRARTTALDGESGAGDPYRPYAFATQVADVEVDPESGKVKVLRVCAAHDVGRAINPDSVRGQIYGGIAMGLGMVLFEEFAIEGGIPGSLNFDSYRIPRTTDMPDVEIAIVESNEPTGPFGAKGIGEPAMIATAPAIANAIADAIGKQVFELPAKPGRILELMKTAD